jgi:hypothetical protein
MIVDLILLEANLGYHDENWKASRESGVKLGNRVGAETAVGIV